MIVGYTAAAFAEKLSGHFLCLDEYVFYKDPQTLHSLSGERVSVREE